MTLLQAFSALRAYALSSRTAFIGIIIFILSLVPAGVNAVSNVPTCLHWTLTGLCSHTTVFFLYVHLHQSRPALKLHRVVGYNSRAEQNVRFSPLDHCRIYSAVH